MRKKLSVFIAILLLVMTAMAQKFQITGGFDHSIMVTDDGSVYTFGNGEFGQLGIDENGNSIFNTNTPVKVGGLPKIVKVAAGGQYSVALSCEGSVYSWGNNSYGQLGNGSLIGINSYPTPKEVLAGETNPSNPNASLQNVISISACDNHTCAVWIDLETNKKHVIGWGNPSYSQIGDEGSLGNGTFLRSEFPVFVLNGFTGEPLEDVEMVTVSDRTALALTKDGRVWSWGKGSTGQIGRPITSDASVAFPVQLENGIELSNIKKVIAGIAHVLALDYNGNVWGWGGNWQGQVEQGNPNFSNTPYPTLIFAGPEFRALNPEAIYLGDGDPIIDIAAGLAHSLFVTESGKAFAMGENRSYNSSGILGVDCNIENSMINYITRPMLMKTDATTFIENVIGVNAGVYWSFIITKSGVFASGNNRDGQLGIGSSFDACYLTNFGPNNLAGYVPTVELDSLVYECPNFEKTLSFLVKENFVCILYKDGDFVDSTFVNEGYENVEFVVTEFGNYRVEIHDRNEYEEEEFNCGFNEMVFGEISILPYPNTFEPVNQTFEFIEDSIRYARVQRLDTTKTRWFGWYATETSEERLALTSNEDSLLSPPISRDSLQHPWGRTYKLWVQDEALIKAKAGYDYLPQTSNEFGDHLTLFYAHNYFNLKSVDVIMQNRYLLGGVQNEDVTVKLYKIENLRNDNFLDIRDYSVIQEYDTIITTYQNPRHITLELDFELSPGMYGLVAEVSSDQINYSRAPFPSDSLKFDDSGFNYLELIRTYSYGLDAATENGCFFNWQIEGQAPGYCEGVPRRYAVEIEKSDMIVPPPGEVGISTNTGTNYSCTSSLILLSDTINNGVNYTFKWYKNGEFLSEHTGTSSYINLSVNNGQTGIDTIDLYVSDSYFNDIPEYTQHSQFLVRNVPYTRVSMPEEISECELGENSAFEIELNGIFPITFTYNLNGEILSATSENSNLIIENIDAGEFSIVDVRDSLGCSSYSANTSYTEIHPANPINLSTQSIQLCENINSADVSGMIISQPENGLGEFVSVISATAQINSDGTEFIHEGVGEYILTYMFTDTSTQCSAEITDTVFVNPLPTVEISVNDTVIVFGDEIIVSSIHEHTNYAWTGEATQFVTSSLDAREINITAFETIGHFPLILSAANEYGCIATDTVKVIVTPDIFVDIEFANRVCESVDSLTINVITDADIEGYFTVNNSGVIDSVSGVFRPSLSGAGEYSITYVYEYSGREYMLSSPIDVLALPIIDISDNPSIVCEYDSAIQLVANIDGLPASGGLFSGAGVSTDNTFTPNRAGEGIHTITFNYTHPLTTCVALPVTHDILVQVTPALDGIMMVGMSTNVTSQADLPNICPLGTNIEWFATTNTDVPAVSTEPCYTFSYIDDSITSGTMQDGEYSIYATQTINGCRSVPTKMILVLSSGCQIPAPEVVTHFSCVGDTVIEVSASIDPTASHLGWWLSRESIPANPRLGDEELIGNTISTPGALGVGIYSVYVANYFAEGECYSPVSELTIEVKELPNPQIEDPGMICYTQTEVDLSYSPANATLSGDGISGSTWTTQISNPLETGVTNTIISISATSVWGEGTIGEASCSNTNTQTLSVTNVVAPTGTGIESPAVIGIEIIDQMEDMIIHSHDDAQVFVYAEDGTAITLDDNGRVNLYNEGIISEIGDTVYKFYVYQSLNGCISDTVESVWNVVGGGCHAISPITNSPLTTCLGDNNFELTAQGDSIVWFDSEMSQISNTHSITPSYDTAGTYIYYVAQISTNPYTGQECISEPVEFEHIVLPYHVSNIVVPQTFCISESVYELDADYEYSIGDSSIAEINPSQLGAGTYVVDYISIANSDNCSSVGSFEIEIIDPATPIANNAYISYVDSILPLKAEGDSIVWYDLFGMPQGVGNEFNHGITTVGTYRFIAINIKNNCSSQPISVMLLVREQICTAPSPIVEELVYANIDDNIVLNAEGNMIHWYNASMDSVGFGNTYSPEIDSAGEYEYYVVNYENGCYSDTVKILLVVSSEICDLSVPTFTSTEFVVCENDDITISADTFEGELNWYSDMNEFLYSGNNFEPSTAISGEFTYFVKNVLDGCSSEYQEISVIVYNNPVVDFEIPNSLCIGQVLELPAHSEFVFDNSRTNEFVANESGQFILNVEVSNDNCMIETTFEVEVFETTTPDSDIFTYNINELPTTISVEGENIIWYDAEMTHLTDGNTLDHGISEIGRYVFYITTTINDCESQRAEIVIQVQDASCDVATPSVTIDSISVCQNDQSAMFEATTSANGEINWYADNTLSNLLHTGSTFQPSEMPVGVHFIFLNATEENCVSNTVKVTYNVLDIPSVNIGNYVRQCGGSKLLDAGEFDSYLWNTGSEEQTLLVTESGTYSVTVVDELTSCSNFDDVTVVIQVPYNDQIAIVGYDDLNNRIISWEKSYGRGTREYNLMRISENDDWATIGVVSFSDSLMQYIDTDTLEQDLYSYKLITVDTCGNASEGSMVHTPLSVTFASDNIIWSAYEGLQVRNYYVIANLDGIVDTLATVSHNAVLTYSIQNDVYESSAEYWIAFDLHDTIYPNIHDREQFFVSSSSSNKLVFSKHTQLNKHEINFGVNAYPNPAKSILYVEVNSDLDEYANIEISDVLGKVLISEKVETNVTNNLKVSNFASGLYNLKVIIESEVYTEKITIE